MIVQVRGTSGAGKSTVIREVKAKMDYFEPRYIKGRKMPLFYLRELDGQRPCIILSHYESPCAGCDVLGSARHIFDLLQILDLGKYNILCEGLMLSEDTKWAMQISQVLGQHQTNYYLTTDIEECIERIKKRRAEKGNDKPLNEDNTRRRYEVINRTQTKLQDVPMLKSYRVSQRQAVKRIVKLLTGGVKNG